MRVHRDLGAGQRWLLACLCLLASLVYLTRAVEPSGITPSSPFQSSTMETRGAQAEDHAPGHALPTSPGMDGMVMADGTENHHESATSSAPDLTGAAPNAPPAGRTHQHAAHCPFCFTAAFALEADGAVLLISEGWRPGRAAPTHLQPSLAVLRHAEARAPPMALT